MIPRGGPSGPPRSSMLPRMGACGTVWLVGMMGAGKSSVGRALAGTLGLRFLDTDAEIERERGLPIAEIFARDGEAAFRSREREVVARWLGLPAVVSLGGGAFAQPEVRALLAGAGTVVYLRARPETLLARLGEGTDRPLLAGLAPAQRLVRLRELLAAREAAYAGADLVVDTDGVAAEAVVERVARALAEREAAA